MATTVRPARNFREYAWLLSPGSWRRYWGERFVGVFGLLCDDIAEGAKHAVLVSKFTSSLFSADTLRTLGEERNMPRFPEEDDDTYKARLQNAWTLWRQAGTAGGLIAVFAAAGIEGLRIFSARNWPTTAPVGHWSQFWAFLPAGTHPVTGLGPEIGTFTVGDGTTIGPTGITATELAAMRATVKNFKPAHWVCRGLVFQISGWSVGDGSVVGDPGLEIGSEHAVVGVY